MMAYEPKTRERMVGYLEFDAASGDELRKMLFDVVSQGLKVEVKLNPNMDKEWQPDYSRLWFVITKEERVDG